jgi:hypothetical protein
MSKEFQINDELTAVEAALKSLRPVASNIDRDRTMFLAGRASVAVATPMANGRRTNLLWPAAMAVSLLLAMTFGGLFFFHGSTRIEKQIVYVDREQPKSHAPKKLWYDNVPSETAKIEPTKPPPGMEGMDYLTLSQIIASKGVEGLPNPKIYSIAPGDLPRNRPLTLRDWEQILGD